MATNKRVIKKAIDRLQRLRGSAEFSGRSGAQAKMTAQIQNLRSFKKQLGTSVNGYPGQSVVSGKLGGKTKVMGNAAGNKLLVVPGARRRDNIVVKGYKNVIGKGGKVKSVATKTKMSPSTSKVRMLTKKTMKKLGLMKAGTRPKNPPTRGGGGRGRGGRKNR